ncbi:cadherin domain-containing protein [Rubrimonas cliftonensis]|uniref:Ca2+-binding protein, RTX toxin-related n=1 Tax=Rubrimonas cliftonensis TaxID=89524 RepID=A0A1H4DKE0_9RHOB|nr:cadherin domain-containing protein [Rubrimonas cliftonensis]SEA73047.1 Ca2+-binding protein, RTX toxin-related [Rubrimonas cliftonensis]
MQEFPRGEDASAHVSGAEERPGEASREPRLQREDPGDGASLRVITAASFFGLEHGDGDVHAATGEADGGSLATANGRDAVSAAAAETARARASHDAAADADALREHLLPTPEGAAFPGGPSGLVFPEPTSPVEAAPIGPAGDDAAPAFEAAAAPWRPSSPVAADDPAPSDAETPSAGDDPSDRPAVGAPTSFPGPTARLDDRADTRNDFAGGREDPAPVDDPNAGVQRNEPARDDAAPTVAPEPQSPAPPAAKPPPAEPRTGERPTFLISETDPAAGPDAPTGAVSVTGGAIDAFTGDGLTFALLDDAGGRFAIDPDTGEITVAPGGGLDYETATRHTVVVRANGAGGASIDRALDIAVSDVAETIRLGDGGVAFVDGGVAETAIIGGTGNDTIAAHAEGGTVDGGAGADRLLGGAGNDALAGGAGSDAISGGDGVDTAIWRGALADFAVSHDAVDGGFTITDGNASDGLDEGTDRVDGVETFSFDGVELSAAEMRVEAARQANAAPEAPTAAGLTLAEDAAAGDVAATLSANDAEGDALTYTLTDASGNPVVDSDFEIVGAEIRLRAGAVLDHETSPTRTLNVTASDAFETSAPTAITIAVTDVDEAALGATGDADGAADAVDENLAAGAVVGVTARASDADGTATVTYALSDDAGGRFAIDAATGVVTTAAALDHETAASHAIEVLSTSSDGTTSSRTFTITVNDLDEAALGATGDADGAADAVDENLAAGAVVGVTARASDADGTATVTYALSDDAGGRFAIDAATGVVTTAAALDHETAASHAIEVLSTSSDGTTTSETFTITVNDLNEAALGATGDADGAADAVDENLAAGAVVGVTARASDADGTATVTYALSDDAGGRFAIDAATGVVTTAAALDHETAASHAIEVTSISSDGSTTSETFTIDVTDAAEILQLANDGASFTDTGVAETAILGGSGNDTITAHDDGGSIDGGAGDDTLQGRSGEDILTGGGGADLLQGRSGDDTLTGGAGDDTLYGEDGGDSMTGDAGADRIWGGAGADTLDGGDDDDQLHGEDGDDTLQGGGGADTLRGDAGDDVIDGGDGSDRAVYEGDLADFAVVWDDAAQRFTITDGDAADGLDEGADTVSGVEIFQFGGVAYTEQQMRVEASRQANSAPGAPSVASGGSIAENSGAGVVVATLDALDADGDPITYVITDAGGSPVVDSDFEIVGAEVRVRPGAALDFETAASRQIFVTASDAFETSAPTQIAITINDAAETIQLADGGASFTDTGVAETAILGGDGGDAITANAAGGTIDGGAGNDTLQGGVGDDSLTGGAGDDVLSGGGGGDTAVWAGDLSGFSVAWDAGTQTFTITDLNSGDGLDEGADTVTGVETFVFDGVAYTAAEMQTEAALQANSAPTAPTATGDTVAEDATAGALVATLASTDADGDPIAYVITDAGGNPVVDSDFEIVGAELRVKAGAGLDYETAPTRTLYVKASDALEESAPTQITITVNDAAETIQLADGGASFTDTGVAETAILGGDGGDAITANAAGGTIDGGAGNDTLQGGVGDDSLTGGAGDDVLNAGDGADYVLGGSGADLIRGEAGDDWLEGREGDDTIYGGDGDDVIDDDAGSGGGGADVFHGEGGNDQIYGGDDDDSLYGGAGDDTMSGETGDNYLSGGDGADELHAGGGANVMHGDADNDTFVMWAMGDSTIDGGETVTTGTDDDLLDLSNLWGTSVGVVFNDSEAGTVSDGVSTLSFTGIERLWLTDGDDQVDGSGATAGLQIDAGAGDDTLEGGAGDDILDGGDGEDGLTGGAGRDTLRGGVGSDTLMGGADDDDIDGGDGSADVAVFSGNRADYSAKSLSGDVFTVTDERANGAANEGADTVSGVEIFRFADGDVAAADLVIPGLHLVGGGGNDTLEGLGGDDTIEGRGGADRLVGDGGDDSITGGNSQDTILGGDGRDTISGGGGHDSIDSGAGDDVVTTSNGNDTIYGGAGDDIISAGGGSNWAYGGDGADLIELGGANDKAWGDAGDDTIVSGEGHDTIYGGEGHDLIDLGGGNDRAWGEDGDDTILGGLGDDTISGGLGDDSLSGDDGSDNLTGGEGNDTLDGGARNDTLDGGDGNDMLLGGDGNDSILGDLGADTLRGGAGDDTLRGGDGDDLFVYGAGDGRDGVHGGVGWVDTISLEGMGAGATVIGADRIEGDGWTAVLDSGHSVTGQGSGVIELSDDASGVIVFDDLSELDFSEIERIAY